MAKVESTQAIPSTSAGLAAIITDETGSGSLVFATSPAFTTPTGIVKGDVGLGNVDNTSDATKNSATVTLTNKNITQRAVVVTAGATPTIVVDNGDVFNITGLTVDITNMSTNLTIATSTWKVIQINITGTATRAIAWGASFVSTTISLPTTTVSTNTLHVLLQYNGTTLDCVGWW